MKVQEILSACSTEPSRYEPDASPAQGHLGELDLLAEDGRLPGISGSSEAGAPNTELMRPASPRMDRNFASRRGGNLSFSRLAISSAVVLLRLLPFLFPFVFVFSAVIGSISVLYAAVALHLAIIGAENTVGRFLAKAPITPALRDATFFEDTCLLVWPLLHLAALAAALYLIVHIEPTARQVFAIGAIFGYSINTFSVTAGHELLHQNSRLARVGSDLLYAAMLYPHFPTVHLASHHRWAGSNEDCQTPRPGQGIYPYLGQALVGGLRVARTAQAAALDRRLHWRVVAAALGVTTLALVGTWQTLMFLFVQGLFSFIVIETLNYVQHYKPMNARASAAAAESRLANQELNFISRCVLFNLPLHASHHADPGRHCTHLTPICVSSYCWGYWTSFWLAWTPPLWIHLNRLEAKRET